MKTFRRLLVAFALAVALSVYAHRAHAAQTFSGPGLFVSQNTCTDILNPVAGQSWCFDSTNNTIKYWSGTAWVAPFSGAFPLSADANFNNYSGVNISQLDLWILSPPSSIAATATCSGTCATTYTYKVTCINDIQAETLPSVAATAVNAASLSSSNFNVITWSAAGACYGGYNVYGRTAGALVLLANVANGTTTYTDQGAAAAAASYTLTWSQPAYATVGVWDLRGTGPIDAALVNNGAGTTLTATGFTTTANHDIEIPIFGFAGGSSIGPAQVFTPPAGFSNAINVAAPAGNTNRGFWGGTKDIAVAGVVANQTGTVVNVTGWAGFHLGILSSNPASAVTVVGTTSATAPSPYTSVSFNDVSGALAGDAELVCVAWGANTGLVPVGPTAPASFSLIGAVGIPNSGGTVVTCYTVFPTASATGVPPPTVNSTGILKQNGGTEETLLGIQHFSANNGGLFNGAASSAPMASVAYPMAVAMTACRASWSGFAGCAPFPTFAIKDITAGTVLCSSGTVSGTSTDQNITPSTTAFVPANDVIAFIASTNGASCTAGLASMTAVLKE